MQKRNLPIITIHLNFSILANTRINISITIYSDEGKTVKKHFMNIDLQSDSELHVSNNGLRQFVLTPVSSVCFDLIRWSSWSSW